MPTNNAINLNAAGVPTYDGAGTFTASTVTQNALLYGGAANAISSLALTDGQLPIGNTGSAPSASTLTAGTGISIANGSGTITISSSGGGLTWTEVTGTSQAAAVNNGYILNNAGTVTVTLPANFALGDTISIVGKGAGGWVLAANTGDVIYFGSSTSSAGGNLASTNRRDCVQVLGITANSEWEAQFSVGNLTVA